MGKVLRSKKKKKEHLRKVIDTLKHEYPEARIQLRFDTDFQLMVATVLSAQCTDKRVNMVTKDLFAKFPELDDYFDLDQEVLEKEIFSTGFYKAKAKNIIAAAKKLKREFDGKVPDNMDDLLKIPGVGRKTANVLLGHLHDTPAIVVDTHVIKIMNRLGIVDNKNPDKIERELMQLIPKEDWVMFTHYMISHGRAVCLGRKPNCNECVIANICPSAEL